MRSKEIVRLGYDAVSYAYRGDDEDEDCAQYHQWLDELIPQLSPGKAVLDLGCGCGIPVCRRLATRYQVTGVDSSPVQIKRAQRLVPTASLICADMTAVDFPPESFQAIVSFYAIIHVPLPEQPQMFRKMHRWLEPGGYLMMTVGSNH